MQETRNNRRGYLVLLILWLVVLAILFVGTAAAIFWLVPAPVVQMAQPTATVTPAPEPTDTPTLEATVTAAVENTATATPPVVGNVGGRSIGDPYAPELGNTGYDVQRYTLQLTLDPAVTFVQGTTTIEAISMLDNLAQLSLDFIGFEIEAVTVDDTSTSLSTGLATTFRREEDKLILDLPRPLAIGEPFSISVAYQGEPVRRPSPYLGAVEHLGLSYPGNDTIYVLAEPDGARYWFPNNDHPRDKATFRFELAVPPGLTAVANGQLIERRADVAQAMPDGSAGDIFIWEHNYPMATYLALVAVGPYERLEDSFVNGIPLRHYIFSELQADFERATAVTVEAMAWMGELFGPYPFEVYGYVTVYVPNVSMETQTMVVLSHQMMNEDTVIHELAHMWFGNWVSLDSWGDMWRNEGFATYVTIMWETRDDPQELELRMASILEIVRERDSGYPLGDLPPHLLFSFDSYFKGAALVHALRQEMGDDAFFAGLRTYFERYGGGTASHQEFQATLEEAAGFSLDPFFAEWFAPAGDQER